MTCRTRKTAVALAGVVALALSPAARAIDEYRLDDGAAEDNVGLQNPQGQPIAGNIAILNRMQVEAGAEIITEIRIAFGDLPLFSPVEVYLWGDFNNDGDPSDAFVLESMVGLSQTSNGNAFTTFDINDTQLNVGDYFYIGAIIDFAAGEQPGRIDLDGTDSIPNYPPMNHSWIAGGDINNDVDPNNLSLAQLPLTPIETAFGGTDGTWLVRANATAIPGPAGVAALVIGGLAGIGARRRLG
jgi:hypothetical protein